MRDFKWVGSVFNEMFVGMTHEESSFHRVKILWLLGSREALQKQFEGTAEAVKEPVTGSGGAPTPLYSPCLLHCWELSCAKQLAGRSHRFPHKDTAAGPHYNSHIDADANDDDDGEDLHTRASTCWIWQSEEGTRRWQTRQRSRFYTCCSLPPDSGAFCSSNRIFALAVWHPGGNQASLPLPMCRWGPVLIRKMLISPRLGATFKEQPGGSTKLVITRPAITHTHTQTVWL